MIVAVVAAVVVLAAAVVLVVHLAGSSSRRCQQSFVPAFFVAQGWSAAITDGSGPAVMILNPASGPGTAPDSSLKAAARHAVATGSTVIGYIGTNYGQEPLSQAEAEVRDYKSWYPVKGIFLDQAPTSGTAQLGYYKTLAAYIRREIPGAAVWLNPGVYPDQAYMSVGSVIMAFEGPYTSYEQAKVPSWARKYPASRFAHTVYATPEQALKQAVSLSQQRNAGYVFITPDVGANPYGQVPPYWAKEQADIGACH